MISFILEEYLPKHINKQSSEHLSPVITIHVERSAYGPSGAYKINHAFQYPTVSATYVSSVTIFVLYILLHNTLLHTAES